MGSFDTHSKHISWLSYKSFTLRWNSVDLYFGCLKNGEVENIMGEHKQYRSIQENSQIKQ